MSILGRIFATEKALDKGIDAVVAGMDKLVYTQEEKADARQALAVKGQEILIHWLEKSSGHNLARRWLSMVITSVWLSMYLGAMFFSLIGVFSEDSDTFLSAAGILAGYADSMAGAVMLILAFYFAAPHMAQIIDAIFARMGFRTPKASG